MDGCPKASEIQCMAALPDVCLFVCLFVYLLDVDSWYCSGESVGHRLGNIANQWENIVRSAAAAQYSVMQLGGRTLGASARTASCFTTTPSCLFIVCIFRVTTISTFHIVQTHTHRQAETLFHPIFFPVNFLTETLTSYRFCFQSFWLKNSSSNFEGR